MKRIISIVVLNFLILVTVLSSVAIAGSTSGIYVRPSIFYSRTAYEDKTAAGSGTTTSQNTDFSASLGYVTAGWAYIGATYNYFKNTLETKPNSGASTTTDTTYSEYGPTFGYFTDDWHLLGTYLILADRQVTVSGTGSSTTTGRTGTGFMGELGYRFLTGSFQFGPNVIYRNITYTNCKDSNSGGTSTCNPAVKLDEIIPMFGFSFNFK